MTAARAEGYLPNLLLTVQGTSQFPPARCDAYCARATTPTARRSRGAQASNSRPLGMSRRSAAQKCRAAASRSGHEMVTNASQRDGMSRHETPCRQDVSPALTDQGDTRHILPSRLYPHSNAVCAPSGHETVTSGLAEPGPGGAWKIVEVSCLVERCAIVASPRSTPQSRRWPPRCEEHRRHCLTPCRPRIRNRWRSGARPAQLGVVAASDRPPRMASGPLRSPLLMVAEP